MERKKKGNKKLECLECLHCKTRVFGKKRDLLSWCVRRSIKHRSAWTKEITKFGRVRLMWCDLQTNQFASHGFSPRNASLCSAKNIEKILEEEKNSVFISSQSKKPFVPGTGGHCPFKLI